MTSMSGLAHPRPSVKIVGLLLLAASVSTLASVQFHKDL